MRDCWTSWGLLVSTPVGVAHEADEILMPGAQ